VLLLRRLAKDDEQSTGSDDETYRRRGRIVSTFLGRPSVFTANCRYRRLFGRLFFVDSPTRRRRLWGTPDERRRSRRLGRIGSNDERNFVGNERNGGGGEMDVRCRTTVRTNSVVTVPHGRDQ